MIKFRVSCVLLASNQLALVKQLWCSWSGASEVMISYCWCWCGEAGRSQLGCIRIVKEEMLSQPPTHSPKITCIMSRWISAGCAAEAWQFSNYLNSIPWTKRTRLNVRAIIRFCASLATYCWDYQRWAETWEHQSVVIAVQSSSSITMLVPGKRRKQFLCRVILTSVMFEV